MANYRQQFTTIYQSYLNYQYYNLCSSHKKKQLDSTTLYIKINVHRGLQRCKFISYGTEINAIVFPMFLKNIIQVTLHLHFL